MRALLAGSVCLLAAATAAAQPPAALATPASQPSPPGRSLPAPAANPTAGNVNFLPGSYSPAVGDANPAGPSVDLGDLTSTNSWKMNNQGWWGQADYLLWWIRPMSTPSLIQAVPSASAIASATNGSTLAAGSAQSLFPTTNNLRFGAFSGVRGTAGYNFESFGLEVSGFYLGQQSRSASYANDGTPASIAESYYRAGTGTPVNLFGSLAGQYSGGIAADVTSQLWGAEANVRLPWFAFLTTTTDALTGFRYMQLEEQLSLLNHSTFSDGTSLSVTDSFKTRNNFYGGQVGLDSRIGPTDRGFGLNLLGKVALGDVNQHAEITGSNTYYSAAGVANSQAGGLYARGANSGVFNRDIFGAIFELNTTLTYNFTSWAQVYAGYSIMWLSSAQRPGQLLNPNINDSQARFIANAPASNVTAPIFHWHGSDVTVQGLTFGLKLQY